MNHSFSQVPRADIPRSSFNRSHGHKTTFNAGYLIPLFVDLVYPGDTANMQMATFARLATPIKPFMDNLFFDMHWFAVPLRLVWDNFVHMMGEQKNPGDTTDYLIPQITSPVGGWTVHSLADYFGMATILPDNTKTLTTSSLWHRGYNLIANEWYRDQNLQNSYVVDKDDGPDSPSDYVLLKRGKRHDYFTSCLPWPQKGPAVQIPLGATADVFRKANAPNWRAFKSTSQTPATPGGTMNLGNLGGQTGFNDGASYLSLDPGPADGVTGLYADLSTATAATINALRMSFQIQKLYERDARGGTRFTEIVLSHFGVHSPDARLQRPELLGVSTQPINVNPIAQTAPSDTLTPQGNLAAIASMGGQAGGFVKSFTEHSLIFGIGSVRADLNYQQGTNRMFFYRSRFELYWPALAHIGEQAVLNQEIYTQGTADDKLPFGYQERFAEMRYRPSLITGKFRSQDPQSLDVWHLAQDFSALPALNSAFIQENPPISRVVATPDEPQFLFDSYMKYIMARPMPTYSVPGLIDHF